MRLIASIIVLVLLAVAGAASQQHTVRISATELEVPEGMDLASAFVYSTADSASFASVHMDDGNWSAVDGSDRMKGLRVRDWRGIGWLRTSVRIAGTERDNSICLHISQYGASELYIDGRLVRRFGTVDPSGASFTPYNPLRELIVLDPYLDRSDTSRVHVIAIRYQGESFDASSDGTETIGFGARIGRTSAVATATLQRAMTFDRTTLVPLGMIVALGILHLLFFLFDRKQRVHLLYTCFSVVFGGIFICWHILGDATESTTMQIVGSILGLLWCVIIWVVLLLIAMMFYGRLSRSRIIVSTILTLVTIGIAVVHRDIGDKAWAGLVFLASIDVTRLTIQAIRQRQAGAWIVGLGLLLFIAYTLLWFVGINLQLLTIDPLVWKVIFVTGLVSMPISMSIFLARRVGEISDERVAHERRAAAEEVLRKEIEKENTRKTRELLEARRLQDSMRPSNMPRMPHVQTAVAMRSATEVGGDYFDYVRHSENKLTVAIGDATGHGMKASVLVTATKCHFLMYAPTDDHKSILQKTSEGLRRLHMHGMYMCMALLTIEDFTVTFTAAGIPPLLHYVARTGASDRHTVKGLPLGSPIIPDYESTTFSVEPGDVLVFMTDGLPELFDATRNTLGYEAIERVVRSSAHLSAIEIGNNIVHLTEDWLRGTDNADDITFTVLKVV